MMNTTLAPPTTVNTLNKHEKARLVRSTRKLEAILGTTPHLTEVEPIHITLPSMNPPPSPRTKAARRHGSIFTVFPVISLPDDTSVYSSPSSNSSLSSLTLLQDDEPRASAEILPTPRSFSSRPRRCADAPPPLHLRVNTVPASPSDSRIPRSPISPFVAASVQPVTPITPELPPRLSEAEMRRKRMAKLARTFGETVPAEYVFPSTTATRPRNIPAASTQTRHARTETLPHVAVTISSSHARRSSQVWTTGDQGGFWSGQWNRKDIREVQHKLRTLRAK